MIAQWFCGRRKISLQIWGSPPPLNPPVFPKRNPNRSHQQIWTKTLPLSVCVHFSKRSHRFQSITAYPIVFVIKYSFENFNFCPGKFFPPPPFCSSLPLGAVLRRKQKRKVFLPPRLRAPKHRPKESERGWGRGGGGKDENMPDRFILSSRSFMLVIYLFFPLPLSGKIRDSLVYFFLRKHTPNCTSLLAARRCGGGGRGKGKKSWSIYFKRVNKITPAGSKLIDSSLTRKPCLPPSPASSG